MDQTAPVTSIGRRIAEERERAGMSQGVLAKLVGLDRIKVNKIENGHRDVSHSEALSFAAALGLDVQDLAPTPERVHFRDWNPSPESAEAIRLFKEFVDNWRTIKALRSLDED